MTLKPLEGEIFVVDKPLGWSSFHVVKKLRGMLTARLRPLGVKKLKVGHAGTLDPLASGLMILCSGKATRNIDTLQAGVKEYLATVRLGATTPSFDLETPYDSLYPTAHITRELVEETLQQFVGAIDQVPPEYSACKIDGHRAYKMARSGREVNLKAKKLVIDEIELTDYRPGVELPELASVKDLSAERADGSAVDIDLRIVCSKGTYIRALARDIGQALGTGAHLAALRRTRVGDFTLSQALDISGMVAAVGEAPMQIADDNGNMIDAASLGSDRNFAAMDKADILPFYKRVNG